ncbi:hypothetical protein PYCCODRAFT_1065790 [Trametes coccinea BRFM310]|uniref:Uncharacterized protein n=1 Tax=Trametes coccinea (strain BRFM310) TaxID=1353009 RepID=A0A1Y2IZ72_TRAC3|nr:hypothetical protein PYCCODRAFT_1065790 [Trametes coccinea BRFM310]
MNDTRACHVHNASLSGKQPTALDSVLLHPTLTAELSLDRSRACRSTSRLKKDRALYICGTLVAAFMVWWLVAAWCATGIFRGDRVSGIVARQHGRRLAHRCAIGEKEHMFLSRHNGAHYRPPYPSCFRLSRP